MAALELWFGIEGVYMRRPTVHENVNDALGPRGKVWRFRVQRRASQSGRLRCLGQSLTTQRGHPHARMLQKPPAAKGPPISRQIGIHWRGKRSESVRPMGPRYRFGFVELALGGKPP